MHTDAFATRQHYLRRQPKGRMMAVKNAKPAALESASFRTLAEVSPAGIWRTTADGQSTYVNPAWLEATGLADDEWQGEGWASAIHPDDHTRVFESFASAVAAGSDFHKEWRWLRPDGSTPWVLSMGAPERDDDGNIVAYVGINIDISERRKLTEDLEASRQKAEHATLAKSRFLANMSHEIRTPMNGVIGFTDLLLGSDLDATQRRYATLIADPGRAMMALLNDVLDVSKIEAGLLAIETVRIDLFAKLRHCASLMEANAVAKSLDLAVRIEQEVPQSICGDPLRLRQILLNLLGNAVKFTDAGGIEISAAVRQSPHGERLRIAVRDTGVGIPADKIDRIFDPFSQADGSTARIHGGTGLGLSISRQLAQKMGGTLTVESDPGEGSTFILDLPLERAAGRRTDRISQQRIDTRRLAGKHVLVAEDHDINQQWIVAICAGLGLKTTLAGDGLEALMTVVDSRSRGAPFDAVLMDVQMPRLDGLEATRRLRASGVNAKELPIVALSANCYPEDIAACLASGMQDHVGKPVEAAALATSLLKLWPTDASDAPPPERPESTMAALAARFAAQRDSVLDRIESCLGNNSAADWQAIAAELHKIAGTAAHFGKPGLGGISRTLERGLVEATDDAYRLALLSETLPEFRRAA